MQDAVKMDSRGETEPLLMHPAWVAFVRFCRELKHGEIERLAVQDGLPVLAEMTKKKIKFTKG